MQKQIVFFSHLVFFFFPLSLSETEVEERSGRAISNVKKMTDCSVSLTLQSRSLVRDISLLLPMLSVSYFLFVFTVIYPM